MVEIGNKVSLTFGRDYGLSDGTEGTVLEIYDGTTEACVEVEIEERKHLDSYRYRTVRRIITVDVPVGWLEVVE